MASVKYDVVSTSALAILKQFQKMYGLIEILCSSRDTSLALTKLQQSYMWCLQEIRDDQLERTGEATAVPVRG